MGIYLNPGNLEFKKRRDKEIFVDKSLLIDEVWKHAHALNEYICFSRPRRFGKSTDAHMLTAFFSKGCDSKELFEDLKISQCGNFERKLQYQMNSHNVIHLDMQKFLSKTHNIDNMIISIYNSLEEEIEEELGTGCRDKELSALLERCFAKYGECFIFIVDEWDCIFREFKEDGEVQKKYLDYLRLLFKDQPYIELVYMTGILPIKKYGTHSALNMFDEISMVDAKGYSKFAGFTESEVEALCEKYGADFGMMKAWYNGYQMRDGICTYSPRSVVASIYNKDFANYWSQTETYEALKEYIGLNYDGLRDDVITLLTGRNVCIDTISFQNDMNSFASKDDILTLLVHLGYLGYLYGTGEVYIPNYGVRDTFVISVQNSNWDYISRVFRNSKDLLEATWRGQSERVASYIENSHYETSILQYNDENALAYTVSLAYIAARQKYTIIRELPAGRGYADMVFVPRKGENVPAMVVELKYDKDAEAGIRQIKDRKYFLGLEDYMDNLLLVSISYQKDKTHECVIEKLVL